MPGKPIIWIIDTTVFLNILDVPQFNQDRKAIFGQFEKRIENGDSFLLPFTTIIETGNHIAQINNGNQRKAFAQKFSKQVLQSLDGNTPYKTIGFPESTQFRNWLVDFPNNAQAGKGIGDHMIIKQWEEQCEKFGAHIVKIWSTDRDLQGYECNH